MIDPFSRCPLLPSSQIRNITISSFTKASLPLHHSLSHKSPHWVGGVQEVWLILQLELAVYHQAMYFTL
jgi:hypothetical protein